MVKGKQFTNFRDVGDPVSAARIYNAQNADELIFIDIEASANGCASLIKTIERVSSECFMPLTVGGGIHSLETIKAMLRAGADKVVITTAAVENPTFIEQAANMFGRQCIVVGVDVKKQGSEHGVFIRSGAQQASIELLSHIQNMQRLGAGEIFINSIDRDGMMQGYDLELLSKVREWTTCPVIACGGAGNFKHLVEAIEVSRADAVACSSLFHFGDNNPIRARSFMKNAGLAVKTI
jgi:cyclase